MNDGKSFFFNLCVVLISWRKRVIIVCYWFLVNVVRVGGVCSGLENLVFRLYFEVVKWSIIGVFILK